MSRGRSTGIDSGRCLPISTRSKADQESTFLHQTEAGSGMASKVITPTSSFSKNKTEVNKELVSINFYKLGVTPGAGVKISEPEAEQESNKKRSRSRQSRLCTGLFYKPSL